MDKGTEIILTGLLGFLEKLSVNGPDIITNEADAVRDLYASMAKATLAEIQESLAAEKARQDLVS